MTDSASPESHILVVGAGMAAHRFVACLLREPDAPVRVTVIGDEDRAPYDRSDLAGVLSGADPQSLLLDPAVFRDDRVRLIRDDRVLRIDPAGRTVRTRSRRTYAYDILVLATGSYAARVAVDGARLPGCFLFRTIDDAESVRDFVHVRAHALGRPLRGAVIGGGVRGLQAALALQDMGVGTTVVQYPDRVLPAHLDAVGAEVLQEALERRGIAVRTRTRTTRLDPDESGLLAALEFQDGSFQRADVVLFTVGVRPRDELARNAGLGVDPRGGVLIDDRCMTTDPHILAVGAVARIEDRGADESGSAQTMAEVAAARVLGRDGRIEAQHPSMRVSLAGVDIASFGEPFSSGADAVEVVIRHDPQAGVHRKLVLSSDARRLRGGVLVGDVTEFDALRALLGAGSDRDLSALVPPEEGPRSDDVAGCDHIGVPHARLLAAVRTAGLSTFGAIRARFGRDDCERCTRMIARVLIEVARLTDDAGTETVTGPVRHRLTRVQSDGTYTIRPAAMGRALAPGDLVALGRIAEEFVLEPRIVSGRIELWGARSQHVASVLERLTAAGLVPDGRESGGRARTSSRGRSSVANGWGYRLAGAEQ